MPRVPKELGKRFEEVFDESNKEYDLGNKEKSLQLLEQAWEELPGDKITFFESYELIHFIIETALEVNDKESLKKWGDLIWVADPERITSGEREYEAGRVAYALGYLEKAKIFFIIANERSGGRAFHTNAGKYLRLLKS